MSIELITGPMFSGKTEALIRRLRAAETGGCRARAFKHCVDDRYSSEHLVSHSGLRFPAVTVTSAQEILSALNGPPTIDHQPHQSFVIGHSPAGPKPGAGRSFGPEGAVPQPMSIGIDEAQFFGLDLRDVARTLASRGFRLIVAGLDLDYLAQPFETTVALSRIANKKTRRRAVCAQCGKPAAFTHRSVQCDNRVLVGGTGIYEPRCRACFIGSRSLAKNIVALTTV